jgi:hypothetical protein
LLQIQLVVTLNSFQGLVIYLSIEILNQVQNDSFIHIDFQQQDIVN